VLPRTKTCTTARWTRSITDMRGVLDRSGLATRSADDGGDRAHDRIRSHVAAVADHDEVVNGVRRAASGTSPSELRLRSWRR
jgi:hypothetical protein